MRQLLGVLALCALFALPSVANAQCDPPLDPVADGSVNPLPSLIMSEINPGDYIELFNTTASPIALSASPFWLCSPFDYAQLSAIAGAVTVPAGGYATVPWPGNFSDTDAGGEIQLFKDANFGSGASILDFVCWGVNPHGSRKLQAEGAGKWSGACAPALTNGALHRKPNTNGTSAAHYDATLAASPMNCAAPPTTIGDVPRARSVQLAGFPNPFTASTSVEVSLDAPATVEVAVYAVDGSRVRLLTRGTLPAGSSIVAWNGKDDKGRDVASGTYLVRVSGDIAATHRMTLLR